MAKNVSQDHVTLVANPIEGGVRLRLEIEPGVLRRWAWPSRAQASGNRPRRAMSWSAATFVAAFC